MSKQRIYADGIGTIVMSEGVVRVELYNNVIRNGELETTSPEVNQEIIFSVQGFLRAFGSMENLIKQMSDAGLIEHNAKTGVKPAAQAASPNFN